MWYNISCHFDRASRRVEKSLGSCERDSSVITRNDNLKNMKKIDQKLLYKIILVLILLVIIFVGGYWLINKIQLKTVWKKEQIQISLPPAYASALDGLPVSSTEKINPSVVGVMIDNYPDARPQSGLLAAKIVYEAPAEGGLARYFAIFDSEQNVEKVGPVRSARPYFIDWLKEYSGLYMHCGGSPEALDILKNGTVFDLNEMTNGQYFWRDSRRTAPHNLYTSSEKWNKALAARPEDKKIFNNAWLFGEMSSSSSELVKDIAIEYTPDYVVGWRYDESQKNYIRYINDSASLEDGNNLLADTVVVQYVKTRVVDDYGRKEITTEGQGDMRLLRDGKMVRGIWKYENGRTRFYDLVDQQLNLKPGKIWIQIVPKEINTKIST